MARKKPTLMEVANVVQQQGTILSNLDNVIGLYIKMKGDLEKFNDYIVKEMDKKKEAMKNEQKTNERADEKNIQPNSKNEGSGSKRVRKENK
tara:strand:+ start:516 stop:791 length:276 start_codon:yes stop_codon:yes gene_type:complete